MALGKIGQALSWLPKTVKQVGATLGLATCLAACGGIEAKREETAIRCAQTVEIADRELSSCIDANRNYSRLHAAVLSEACPTYQTAKIRRQMRTRYLPFMDACVAGKDMQDCDELSEVHSDLSSGVQNCGDLKRMRKDLRKCWPTQGVVSTASYLDARLDIECRNRYAN